MNPQLLPIGTCLLFAAVTTVPGQDSPAPPEMPAPETPATATEPMPGPPGSAPNDPYQIKTAFVPEEVAGEVAAIETTPTGERLLLARDGRVYRFDQTKETWDCWSSHELESATGLLADYWPRSLYVVHATGIHRLFDEDRDGVCDFVKAAVPAWRFGTLGRLFQGTPVAFPEGDLLLAPNVTEGAWSGVLMRVPEAIAATPWFEGPFQFSNPSTGPEGTWLISARSKPSSGPAARSTWAGLWLFRLPQATLSDSEEAAPKASAVEPGASDSEADAIHPSSDLESAAANPESETAFNPGTDLSSPPFWMEFPDVYLPPELMPALPLPGAYSPRSIQGSFGPFTGQVFVGSRTSPRLLRVMLDHPTDSSTQGAVTDFASLGGEDSGLEGLHFDSSGSELFLIQEGHLLSIRPTGHRPHAVRQLRQATDGFEIEFTTPIDREVASNPESWQVSALPLEDPDSDPIAVILSDDSRIIVDFDGLTATWQATRIEPRTVYRFDLSAFVSESGLPLSHGPVFYTTGSEALTQAAPQEAVVPAKTEVEAPSKASDDDSSQAEVSSPPKTTGEERLEADPSGDGD